MAERCDDSCNLHLTLKATLIGFAVALCMAVQLQRELEKHAQEYLGLHFSALTTDN